ncbi:uncharacterized protein EI90DRAFT_2903948 [Cantharellus anzutake]|uniref:uncharacterized protein n=1 Tax=Cantharellus anzutake TaxID=1750568 RepID=UPI0019076E1A|nr:uncharacterized protein EI90DRAFT_2903948 [Cantharellus anzutake]KAF8342109.1 hypothetical protein EI90DRAFT_2903948 [Cantharellus anzutake]
MGLLSEACNCGESHHSINVLAIYWDRYESVDMFECHQRPVADQLLARGLFPCAPCKPSLAFSLEMLEFASQFFVHMAPNNHAFVATIEVVLAANGFPFQTEDSLQRRFSNALLHYQILIWEVDAEVQRLAREPSIGQCRCYSPC